jgi:glycosyltransferase involved in cell wall biosynthesis
MRLAVVGISHRQVCGVRDHGEILARELQGTAGVSCTVHWLTRQESSLGGSRAEVRAWTRRLADELQAQPPDAILLHYSVFAYSHRGVPVFVAPTLAAVRRSRVPIVAFMHELAYSWNTRGPRARVWALTQRVALAAVMCACAAVIVTEDGRAAWLRSSSWLPRRPVLVAPVFSTLPPPSPGAGGGGGLLLGVFGYSAQGAAVELILDAVAEMRARGTGVRLRMLGAPGEQSSAGEAWRAAAGSRGLGEVLSFSGALPAQELSDALAACDLLLFSEAVGPTSRKTTLAGALASGTPILAIDGPLTWRKPASEGAIRLAAPVAAALADAGIELLGDERARELLGARGRDFAAAEMSIARSAEAVLQLVGAGGRFAGSDGG